MKMRSAPPSSSPARFVNGRCAEDGGDWRTDSGGLRVCENLIAVMRSWWSGDVLARSHGQKIRFFI